MSTRSTSPRLRHSPFHDMGSTSFSSVTSFTKALCSFHDEGYWEFLTNRAMLDQLGERPGKEKTSENGDQKTPTQRPKTSNDFMALKFVCLKADPIDQTIGDPCHAASPRISRCFLLRCDLPGRNNTVLAAGWQVAPAIPSYAGLQSLHLLLESRNLRLLLINVRLKRAITPRV